MLCVHIDLNSTHTTCAAILIVSSAPRHRINIFLQRYDGYTEHREREISNADLNSMYLQSTYLEDPKPNLDFKETPHTEQFGNQEHPDKTVDDPNCMRSDGDIGEETSDKLVGDPYVVDDRMRHEPPHYIPDLNQILANASIFHCTMK